MPSQLRDRGILITGVLLVVVVVLGTSLSFALTPIPDPDTGVITGCYHTQIGRLRVIDPATQQCRQPEMQVRWHQQGPPGEPGPAGQDGAVGPSAYELAVEQGYNGSVDEWLASLVGAQGEQGPAGPIGPGGPAGESCTLADNGDNTATLTCGDTSLVIPTTESGDQSLVSVEDPASVVEGEALLFTISLLRASTRQVAVHYTTLDGTATAPGDYTTTAGTATIVPGATSTSVTVPTVDDSVHEPTETLTLALSSPTNGVLGTGVATGTVRDNDCLDLEPDTKASAANLGIISGDTDANTVTASASICAGDQDWFRFTLTEDDTSITGPVAVSARVELTMATGRGDLNLHVVVGDQPPIGSTNADTATETVLISQADAAGNQTTDVWVQVLGADTLQTNDYQLYITGNVAS